ncbi:N-6 DNA methylase [Polyangium sp. 6x1]|uniref:HsdM family class I SAM-dependent methyltransferase n=1 Tax=Polyangium sp. 6x1 TaxID=3042689 RepID=UPI002482DE29|nr:N-6 DNA methylase [Polyangium sp. 6x1]MDI1444691.1 N-6 DNA methylase [Polyangium sp. 6x1]
MLLPVVHQFLGWPSPEEVVEPSGAGPGVIASLAQDKIGRALSRLTDARVRVGILAENPRADTTEAPIAIVCEFDRPVEAKLIEEARRLAWNFCRSRLLVTLEPHLIRAWTCWKRPSTGKEQLADESLVASIDPKKIASQAAQSLHWVELATGQFFQKNEPHFMREERADLLLLANLKQLRKQMKATQLPEDIIHDLLARVIFIQFLMQRLDAAGVPALSPAVLRRLYDGGVLSNLHTSLDGILSHKGDAYQLFKWLNDKFNGDLFPGEGDTPEAREAEWQREMSAVGQTHLSMLADFIGGRLKLEDGQACLWPMYSFDVIPLEFISSIYEEFVHEDQSSAGAHYTPEHIVDLVLDSALPWTETQWNLRILDPACGSGVFLVKCFQRLIHRWRSAHPDDDVNASVLATILKRNICGIDIHPSAVRVASFSLYLSMCDQIDPRHYWTQVKFPRLRNRSIMVGDFFSPTTVERLGQPSFDLVVGNAPWGEGHMTEDARVWSRANKWVTANDEIGTLFLPRAAELSKPDGTIVMLQPAGALLFNRSKVIERYRKRLFTQFAVTEIANLSALRFGLFSKSLAPSCVITMQAQSPARDHEVLYYSTKQRDDASDERVVIEPHDIHFVKNDQCATDPWLWSVLTWGGNRDLELIHRLRQQPHTLGTLKSREGWIGGEGYKRGNRKLIMEDLADGTYAIVKPGHHLLPFEILDSLEPNWDPAFDDGHFVNKGIFNAPILLMGKSCTVEHGFRSAIVDRRAIFPASSVYGMHFPEKDRAIAEATCAVMGSSVARYFFTLTSGRVAFYRPEVLVKELLCMPIGDPSAASDVMQRIGYHELAANASNPDTVAGQWLGLREFDWLLIDDFCRVTLADFRQPHLGVGKAPASHDVLMRYCETFVRCIGAGFSKKASATLFSIPNQDFPVRLVAIHLGVARDGVEICHDTDSQLIARLQRLNDILLSQRRKSGGIFYQATARVYDSVQVGARRVPTVYLVKPNRMRYWTGSRALRDADDVAADIIGSSRMDASQ